MPRLEVRAVISCRAAWSTPTHQGAPPAVSGSPISQAGHLWGFAAVQPGSHPQVSFLWKRGVWRGIAGAPVGFTPKRNPAVVFVHSLSQKFGCFPGSGVQCCWDNNSRFPAHGFLTCLVGVLTPLLCCARCLLSLWTKNSGELRHGHPGFCLNL